MQTRLFERTQSVEELLMKSSSCSGYVEKQGKERQIYFFELPKRGTRKSGEIQNLYNHFKFPHHRYPHSEDIRATNSRFTLLIGFLPNFLFYGANREK